MYNKIASNIEYSIELSFSVPDEEKQIAELASERFEGVLGALRNASDHLNVIYIPFKKAENISVEDLVKKRGLLNRYKRKVIDNFNIVKKRSLAALKEINHFTSDSSIQGIINSFVSNIGDIEKQVNILVEVLDNYRSPDFKDDVVSAIDSIREQVTQTETFINDRVIDYIDTNIRANSWINSEDDGIADEIVDKIPIVVQLVNERQQALDNAFPSADKESQPLNPSDANRMLSPDFKRNPDIGG